MKNNKKLLMLAPLSAVLISSALAGSFISTNNNTKTNSVLLRQEKTIEGNQAQVTADFDNNGDDSITGADFYTAPINQDGTLINESEEWVSINDIDFEDLNDDTYVLQKNIYIDYKEFGSISENISLDGKNIDMNGHVVYGYNTNSFYGQDIKLNDDHYVNEYYLIDSFSNSIIENGAFIGTPFLFNNVVNSTLKNVYVSGINVNINTLIIGDSVENGLIINSIDENSILNGVSFVNNYIDIEQLKIETKLESGDALFRLSLIGETNFTSDSSLNIIDNDLIIEYINPDLFTLQNLDIININVDFLGEIKSSNFLLNILNNSISVSNPPSPLNVEYDIAQITSNADYYVNADKTYIDNIITANSNSFKQGDEEIISGLDEDINQDEINWNYKPIMPTIYDVVEYNDSKLILFEDDLSISKIPLDDDFKTIGNNIEITSETDWTDIITDVNTGDTSHLANHLLGNNLNNQIELSVSENVDLDSIITDENEILYSNVINYDRSSFQDKFIYTLKNNEKAKSLADIRFDSSPIGYKNNTYSSDFSEVKKIWISEDENDAINVASVDSYNTVMSKKEDDWYDEITVDFEYEFNKYIAIISGLPFLDYKNLIEEIAFKVSYSTIDENGIIVERQQEITHDLNLSSSSENISRADSNNNSYEYNDSLVLMLSSDINFGDAKNIESISITEVKYYSYVESEISDKINTQFYLNGDTLGNNWGIGNANISTQSSSYQYIIVSSMAVFVILLIVLIFVLIIRKTYTNKLAYENDDYIYDIELSEDEQDQLEN